MCNLLYAVVYCTFGCHCMFDEQRRSFSTKQLHIVVVKLFALEVSHVRQVILYGPEMKDASLNGMVSLN